jgi:hypothetical protein
MDDITQIQYLKQRLPDVLAASDAGNIIDPQMLVAIEVRLIRDLIRVALTSAEDVYHNPWWVSFWVALNEEWLALYPGLTNCKEFKESLELIRRWVLGISRMLDNTDINYWQELVEYSEHRTKALNAFIQNQALDQEVHEAEVVC